MGKASSAKKVARAARAGGRKTNSRQRQLGFPIALGLIFVMGLSLVFVARGDRQAAADPTIEPRRTDHWHAAYGVFICDRFVADFTDRGPDQLGIHTHADGLIHIHPMADAGAGRKATLGKFMEQVDLRVTNSSIRLPQMAPFDGRLFKAGETTCDGEPAKVTVTRWESALEAAEGAEPQTVFTEDFRSIRFLNDLAAYTIAFAPEGTEIPPPPGAAQILQNATNDGGGPAGGPAGGDLPIDPSQIEGLPVDPTEGGDVIDTSPTEEAPDATETPADADPATEEPSAGP